MITDYVTPPKELPWWMNLAQRIINISLSLYGSNKMRGAIYGFAFLATGYPTYRFAQALFGHKTVLLSVPLFFTFIIGIMAFRVAKHWGKGLSYE